MNINIFLLRAFELGLSVADLEELNYGDVIDMLIESHNDTYEYPLAPTQADIDAFDAM